MNAPQRGPGPDEVAAAAVIAQPFAIYVAVLAFVAPATESNWAVADPILAILPRTITVAWVPIVSVALAIIWWNVARPSRETLIRAAKEACFGAALACVAVGLLRLAAGPSMPGFIPPEESAGPGYLLSMTAGYSEELVCRLAIMPALFFGLCSRTAPLIAAIASLLVTALFFSLWHAAGEATPSHTYFMTRFVIPGCVMGVVWLVSPSAIVTGHASAHLLIPALFV